MVKWLIRGVLQNELCKWRQVYLDFKLVLNANLNKGKQMGLEYLNLKKN